MVRSVGAWLVLGALLASSCTAEQRICGRMETLCGTTKEDCQQLVKETREAFGEEAVEGVKTCFVEAKSCGEASGCVAGKGIKNLGTAVEGFLKGLLEGATDEKK